MFALSKTVDTKSPFCYNTHIDTKEPDIKLHIHTYFFVTHLDGHLAFGKRNNNYFYIPDEKTYKKHFRKDWKLMEFVTTELGPRIRLNNKKIQENPNRYGEIISWHELVDNDFLTDYEQIQLRRHGEICDPTPCMFN